MFRAAALLLLLSASAMAQHSVWVVAKTAGPGVDFTSLSAAMNAAASGDTILLKSGSYGNSSGPIGLGGPSKTLSITADTGATVNVGAFIVSGLQEGYLVTLSNLRFSSSLEDEPALSLTNNAGGVWLDHCTLQGHPGSWQMAVNPSEALKAVDCDSVVITHSELKGGLAGLAATDSTVFMFRSTVTGAPAICKPAGVPPCGNGGPAITVTGGLLTLQSSTIAGGAPNKASECLLPGSVNFCMCASYGGSALQLEGNAPQVEAYDVQLSGGGTFAPCGFPSPELTQIDSGQFVATAGPGFELTGASPLRAGQASSFDVSGQPGDGAFAVLAIPPASIWIPKFHGPWLTGGDFQILFIGTLPASGGLSFNFTVPSLPPGFESAEFIAQGVRIAPGAGTLLADPYRGILMDGVP